MKAWKLDDAQNHFGEIFRLCVQEPQIVCDKNAPIAAIIDFSFFKKLTDSQLYQKAPSISELLEELDKIKAEEAVEIEIPSRHDRPNAMFEGD